MLAITKSRSITALEPFGNSISEMWYTSPIVPLRNVEGDVIGDIDRGHNQFNFRTHVGDNATFF